MIKQSCFSVEPWRLRETGLDLSCLEQSESVFALSNGHVGWRANPDAGEPHGLPGSYLNGLYQGRPLPDADPAYGHPEQRQRGINITHCNLTTLVLDDEP